MTAAVLEARQALRALAGPAPHGGMARAIEAVARRCGLPRWRAYDLWYGKARRVEASEMDAIRAAARGEKRRAVDDIVSHADRLEALASRLAAIDPEFSGPQIDGLRDASRRLRRVVDGGLKA